MMKSWLKLVPLVSAVRSVELKCAVNWKPVTLETSETARLSVNLWPLLTLRVEGVQNSLVLLTLREKETEWVIAGELLVAITVTS